MKRWPRQLLLAVAASALGACGGGDESMRPSVVTDAPQERLLDIARGAYDAAEYAHAERLYRRALERAWLRDDTLAVATAAYNLAAARLRLNKLDDAAQAIATARAALADQAISEQIDVLLLSAEIAFRRGDSASAGRWLDEGFASATATPLLDAQMHLLAGQIAVQHGDHARARAALDAAQAGLELPAYARLEGRLAVLENAPEKAARAYDREVDRQREGHNYLAMAAALARAGAAYEDAGEFDLAADRLLRAGRSSVHQGNARAGQQWLTQARELATKYDAPKLQAAATAALRELEPAGAALKD